MPKMLLRLLNFYLQHKLISNSFHKGMPDIRKGLPPSICARGQVTINLHRL